MTALYWFRQDLRLHDNPALFHACQHHEKVIAVVTLTPDTWKTHHHAEIKLLFWMAQFNHLSQDLAKLGIPLISIEAHTFHDTPATLLALMLKEGCKALYFNKQYELDEKNRDKAVAQLLEKHQLQVHQFDDQLLAPPGSILNGSGSAFKVFTPFSRAWLKWVGENADLTPLAKPKAKGPAIKAEAIVHPYGPHDNSLWPIGEMAAIERLEQFCQDKIFAYHLTRDFPAITGTSQLSPYLSAGLLSPRQCLTTLINATESHSLEELKLKPGPGTWLNELIWREFYKHIMHHFPDVCRHKPFKAYTDQLPWSRNESHFDAWKNGQTGFPIVDAAMRQMKIQGWMHNRLRMISAMFLSKILFIDWRIGERYFMENLIDGDFAANNGGWQWCASTGTDAVPYFRIFNFTNQSEKFDPEGIFIRKFCPELKNLNNKVIHEPYKRGAKNIDYPLPIVDYPSMRQRTLALFKGISG